MLPDASLPSEKLEQASRLVLAIHEATTAAAGADGEIVAFALACVAGRLVAYLTNDREAAAKDFIRMFLDALDHYISEGRSKQH